ncbi:hypothetical protein [Streptomyces albidoflavus]|uniref:hypothetical protein n=1 Tax=Streptomyces albidoflavus TaxID=1886 RepID=UPI000B2B2472|nr:hypothetical protein [Streptomyces albidoflavus]
MASYQLPAEEHVLTLEEVARLAERVGDKPCVEWIGSTADQPASRPELNLTRRAS